MDDTLSTLLQKSAADILKRAAEARQPTIAKNELGDLSNIDPLCLKLCGLDDISGNTVQIWTDPAAQRLHEAHQALTEKSAVSAEPDLIPEFRKTVDQLTLRQTPADYMPMRKAAADAPRAEVPADDYRLTKRADDPEFSAGRSLGHATSSDILAKSASGYYDEDGVLHLPGGGMVAKGYELPADYQGPHSVLRPQHHPHVEMHTEQRHDFGGDRRHPKDGDGWTEFRNQCAEMGLDPAEVEEIIATATQEVTESAAA